MYSGCSLTTYVAMGPYLLPPRPKDAETMQGSMVRMARSLHQESGMVKDGGREATAPSQTYADAMADYSSYRRSNRYAMPGAVSEAAGRCGSKG